MAPEQCPSCNEVTFVHVTGMEDPNSVCEELVFVAALVRMGFDQAQLNRSAVPNVSVGVFEKDKAARAGVSAGRSNGKYRTASAN
jgi:hypothetical protein